MQSWAQYGKDLTEAEDIKKRWQEYTEELYKKDLHDADNHNGVITHLEPDILECEVKWTLGNITTNKTSGGDKIRVELFQILKDDAVKVLNSICQQISKTQQWPQDWKRSVFIPIPKKGNAKECSNCRTITPILYTSKEMLKILQARLQQSVNCEPPYVQAGFRKGRGTRDQIANIHRIIEKAREFQKNICFIDYAKAFDCVDHNKLWKILKRWEYQTTWPVSWEICVQVKKQQLKLDMEQQTGSKLGKEYIKPVYCHPACLTYMQSTLCKMQGWMKPKLESILPEEISITSDTQMTLRLWQKGKKKLKEESEKVGLKLNIQKTKIMASGSITSWQVKKGKGRGKQWKQWQDFILGGSKSLQMVTAAMKLKDTCSLEEKLWPT